MMFTLKTKMELFNNYFNFPITRIKESYKASLVAKNNKKIKRNKELSVKASDHLFPPMRMFSHCQLPILVFTGCQSRNPKHDSPVFPRRNQITTSSTSRNRQEITTLP